MDFIVLFDRDRHDEVFEDVPGNTAAERYAQLVCEINQAERVPMTLLGVHDCEGLRDVFVTSVKFDGAWEGLREHLQNIYDEVGVAGWFSLVGVGDNLAPI